MKKTLKKPAKQLANESMAVLAYAECGYTCGGTCGGGCGGVCGFKD